MSLDTAKYDSAVALLKGTSANYGLCIASMTASVGLAAAGIVLMTDVRDMRVSSVQSVIFLVAQSFTLSRVSRDWSVFKATDIARPTIAYFGQVVLLFIVALGLSIYNCIAISDLIEWKGFYAMSICWVTVSALCLSKAVRDRNDAGISSKLADELRPAHLPGILRACHGTVEYQIFVWSSAILAVGMMLGLMWTWDADTMAIERKGFVSVCALWCVASSFHLAKLVRDRSDPIKAKELRRQLPFQVLVVLSSIASFGILLGGICMMPLELPKRLYLLVGSGFMLSTTSFLAKHVRDRLELQELISSSESPEVLTPAPTGEEPKPSEEQAFPGMP